jgi:hypothetical protein
VAKALSIVGVRNPTGYGPSHFRLRYLAGVQDGKHDRAPCTVGVEWVAPHSIVRMYSRWGDPRRSQNKQPRQHRIIFSLVYWDRNLLWNKQDQTTA